MRQLVITLTLDLDEDPPADLLQDVEDDILDYVMDHPDLDRYLGPQGEVASRLSGQHLHDNEY